LLLGRSFPRLATWSVIFTPCYLVGHFHGLLLGRSFSRLATWSVISTACIFSAHHRFLRGGPFFLTLVFDAPLRPGDVYDIYKSEQGTGH